MKILKYKLATETNHGTPEKPMMETVLSDVSMPYATEADYQLALSEAWQGEVTVEEVADTTDEIRARRDRLLAATDWAVLPDSPLDAQSLESLRRAFLVIWIDRQNPAGCAPTGAFSQCHYLAADAGACKSALICVASSADSRPAATS